MTEAPTHWGGGRKGKRWGKMREKEDKDEKDEKERGEEKDGGKI